MNLAQHREKGRGTLQINLNVKRPGEQPREGFHAMTSKAASDAPKLRGLRTKCPNRHDLRKIHQQKPKRQGLAEKVLNKGAIDARPDEKERVGQHKFRERTPGV